MIVCPKCGEELEDGTIFCTNCREKLSVTCPNCGKVLKPSAKYCSACGADLAELAKPTCPNCGAELEEGAQYCDQCGHKIADNKAADKKEEVQPHVEKPASDSPAQSENRSGLLKKLATSLNSRIDKEEVPTYTERTASVSSVSRTSGATNQLLKFIPLEQVDVSVLSTPVTQKLYESIMGYNPSYFNDDEMNPVETVTWYDAIRFCNKLSMKYHKQPVYSVSGETDPDCIDDGDFVIMDYDADGYRLLTLEEWKCAANVAPPDFLSPDDDDYEDPFPFSPANDNSEESWCPDNSDDRTHSVAKKQPNELGFYDMFGNVWEWIWDEPIDGEHSFHEDDNYGWFRHYCGGSYRTSFSFGWFNPRKRKPTLGFRIAHNN